MILQNINAKHNARDLLTNKELMELFSAYAIKKSDQEAMRVIETLQACLELQEMSKNPKNDKDKRAIKKKMNTIYDRYFAPDNVFTEPAHLAKERDPFFKTVPNDPEGINPGLKTIKKLSSKAFRKAAKNLVNYFGNEKGLLKQQFNAFLSSESYLKFKWKAVVNDIENRLDSYSRAHFSVGTQKERKGLGIYNLLKSDSDPASIAKNLQNALKAFKSNINKWDMTRFNKEKEKLTVFMAEQHKKLDKISSRESSELKTFVVGGLEALGVSDRMREELGVRKKLK